VGCLDQPLTVTLPPLEWQPDMGLGFVTILLRLTTNGWMTRTSTLAVQPIARHRPEMHIGFRGQ